MAHKLTASTSYRVRYKFVNDAIDHVQTTLVRVPFYEDRSAAQLLQDDCRIKLHVLSVEPIDF